MKGRELVVTLVVIDGLLELWILNLQEKHGNPQHLPCGVVIFYDLATQGRGRGLPVRLPFKKFFVTKPCVWVGPISSLLFDYFIASFGFKTDSDHGHLLTVQHSDIRKDVLGSNPVATIGVSLLSRSTITYQFMYRFKVHHESKRHITTVKHRVQNFLPFEVLKG